MTMTIGRSSKKRKTVYRVASPSDLIDLMPGENERMKLVQQERRDNAIIRDICWIIGRTGHIMGDSPLGSSLPSPSPRSRYLAVPLERLCSQNMDRREGQKRRRDVWYKPPKTGAREHLGKLLWQLSWFVRVDSMHLRGCTSKSVFNDGRLLSWIIAKTEYIMHGQYFASRKFKVHGRSNPAVLFGNPIVNFTNPLDMEFLFIKGEVGINFLRYVCRNISRLFIYLFI